jgi:lysophospholipase L1-like esterase
MGARATRALPATRQPASIAILRRERDVIRGRKRKVGLWLLAGLIAIIGIGLMIVVAQGWRTPSGRPDYVALGSSFAAGAGLGALDPGSPILCARSVDGYPQQLARLQRVRLVDMSCGGAVTRHLLHGGQYFQGPQVRTITRATRLVTLTIGGNDVGYVADLSMLAARHTNSVFGRLVRWFWNGPRQPAARGYDQLRSDLIATLRTIHAAAPQAIVMIATYPTILPPSGTCPVLGLTAAEAGTMRQVGDTLAAVTRSAAEAGGAILVDMHTLGMTHNACSSEPWVRGWMNGDIAPFHPTRIGAAATAQAIASHIKT